MRPADPRKLTAIMEAVLHTIAEYGYQGSSVSRIAQKAGVSDGYLYRHFPGKHALFDHLYAYHHGKLYDYLENRLEESDSLTDFLLSLLGYLVQLSQEQRAVFDYLFIHGHRPGAPTPVEILERHRAFTRSIRDKGVASGELHDRLDVERISFMLFALPVRLICMRREQLFHAQPIGRDDLEYMAGVMLMAWS